MTYCFFKNISFFPWLPFIMSQRDHPIEKVYFIYYNEMRENL
jgi:hypothetical protein